MSDSMDGMFDHHHDAPGHDSAETSWTHAGLDDAMTPLGATDEDSSLGAIHGAADAAAPFWFLQQGNGYCLPASLTEVLSQVSGDDIPDESLVDARLDELGMAPGPDGLPLAAGVPLLESFGVDCHIESGASVIELESYLDQGRSVILGVNADDVWYGQNDPTDNPSGGANHALVVTAIDTTDGTVTLSDPGNPAGNEETVPLSQFEQAWAAGDNQMLVVDSPTEQDHIPDTEPASDHTTDPTQLPTSAPGPVILPMTIYLPYVIEEVAHTSTTPEPGPYTVAAGDTLWDIAERVYGDGTQYTRIAQANGLSNPDLITPGESLIIPQ